MALFYCITTPTRTPRRCTGHADALSELSQTLVNLRRLRPWPRAFDTHRTFSQGPGIHRGSSSFQTKLGARVPRRKRGPSHRVIFSDIRERIPERSPAQFQQPVVRENSRISQRDPRYSFKPVSPGFDTVPVTFVLGHRLAIFLLSLFSTEYDWRRKDFVGKANVGGVGTESASSGWQNHRSRSSALRRPEITRERRDARRLTMILLSPKSLRASASFRRLLDGGTEGNGTEGNGAALCVRCKPRP